MDKIRRKFGTNAVPYAAIVLVALSAFLTFNILFSASTADEYPREILAALVGTLMAGVITTLLLRQQSTGEELKERNVEVFRRKVDAYGAFIDLSLRHVRDGLTDVEADDLRREVFRISLVSSAETVGVVTAYVRAHTLRDSETEMSEVIAAFRKELKLDPLDENAFDDMSAIDAKLRGDINRDTTSAHCEQLAERQSTLLDALLKRDAQLFEGLEVLEPAGTSNGAQANLYRSEGISYTLPIEYGSDASVEAIDGWADFSELAPKLLMKAKAVASQQGFEQDEDNLDMPGFLADLRPDAVPRKTTEGRRVWSLGELADAIVKIERAVQVAGSQQRNR